VPQDWVFPIVLVLFVALVMWFGREIYDFMIPSSATVTVPSFVGETLTDAGAEIARLKLASNVVDHATSDRYPTNVVISQRPDAGTEVRAGRQISFVVSDGIVARLMPDLRYQSIREVQIDLSRARLQLGKVTYARSDVVPSDHVISQVPAPLSSTHEGDIVTLLVSSGGQGNLHVPDFVGQSVDDARAQAAAAGIKIGQIVWTPLGPYGPAHGIVARQVPPAGTRIASYDPVSLDVSAGPNESGYLIHQARVLVSVPQSVDTTSASQLDVRLTMTDATGKYDIYHAFAPPGQKLDFTVTAVGTSVLDMYVNNTLVGETRIGTEPKKVYGIKSSPSPSASP
jgi:beta-lactam-binding protein with PASTA domain